MKMGHTLGVGMKKEKTSIYGWNFIFGTILSQFYKNYSEKDSNLGTDSIYVTKVCKRIPYKQGKSTSQ